MNGKLQRRLDQVNWKEDVKPGTSDGATMGEDEKALAGASDSEWEIQEVQLNFMEKMDCWCPSSVCFSVPSAVKIRAMPSIPPASE